jgi:hypothetical protein
MLDYIAYVTSQQTIDSSSRSALPNAPVIRDTPRFAPIRQRLASRRSA